MGIDAPPLSKGETLCSIHIEAGSCRAYYHLVYHDAHLCPVYAIPGSPISTEKVYDVALQQALEEKFGLNKPLHERYVKCLVDYAHGDFGISYLKIGLTSNEIIASGFPYSLRIGIYASGLIVLFGIAAGILAALPAESDL